MKKEINLLPTSVQKKQKKKRKKKNAKTNKIIFAPLSVLVIVYIGLNFFISGKIGDYKGKIVGFYKELETIEKQKLAMQADIKKIAEIKDKINEKKEYLQGIKNLLNLSEDKVYISDLFKEISLTIPDNVWLYEMKFEESKNNLILKGRAFSNKLVKAFLSKLQKSVLFSRSKLNATKAFENEDIILVSFELESIIKNGDEDHVLGEEENIGIKENPEIQNQVE